MLSFCDNFLLFLTGRALLQGSDSSTDEISQESFRRQRVNRFITEHLLRAGYFETAQKLADYVKVACSSS